MNSISHNPSRALVLQPGFRRGVVVAPPSKSHEHRLLIANYLAGERTHLEPAVGDGTDILATKRCLRALDDEETSPVLDCGESGSTLRFIAPVAAALGKHPEFVCHGHLGERPFIDYYELKPGVYELAGHISSQFVTGLLFALPLLEGNSEILFTTPLESKGYVEMTLATLAKAGVKIVRKPEGFLVAGGQTYRPQPYKVEADWSGAAFWFGMNALGSDIIVKDLDSTSVQPDKAIIELVSSRSIDVSQCPDIFPVLAVVAAGRPGITVFTGIARLRLKECDRVAAMRDVLMDFGVKAEEKSDRFIVTGTDSLFSGGSFVTGNDHRIAMAIAVGATRADSLVEIDNSQCVSKSYPGFFDSFNSLKIV